jgi:hypothetical protein
MKTFVKTLAVAGVVGLAALSAGEAKAWWGWGGPWSGGPFDGNGMGDFNMSMRGSGSGYGHGYGHPYGGGYGPWGGYGPYGYGAPYGGAPYGGYGAPYAGPWGAPYAPPAPPAAPAAK